MRRFRSALILIATVSAMTGIAQAQTPPALSDLEGARAAGGETQMQARGYVYVRGTTGDDRKWGYWWNAAQQQCVSVATMEGRFASIVTTPAPDCGKAVTRPAPAEGPAPQAYGGAIDLGLVCFGDGRRPQMATRYGWTWNERRDRYDYGNRTELATEDFDASVMIQIWNGGGRIRLPRKLIPPIHSRGSEGWWDLQDVASGPDRITGTYRLNGLNKPRVQIDRRSGRVTIQGMSDYGFRGTCDLVDGQDHRRF